MRHRPIFDSRRHPTAQVTTLTHDYANGHFVERHLHDQDQLIFAVNGVMTIETPQGLFVVPASRAVWVPAHTVHSIRMAGAVHMMTIYLKPRITRQLPRDCHVVNVSPLLREIVIHICAMGTLTAHKKSDAPWLAILLEQLGRAKLIPLEVALPRDERALRVAQAVMKDPSDRRSLATLCKKSGASKRTIERSFQHETSMTFGRWRQQFALLHAIRRLAAGDNVTTVALEVGYATPSAFIAMFRRALGKTPSHYFRDDGPTSSPSSSSRRSSLPSSSARTSR
ncbi:MAG: helix-turn-helix transcriptional regulator [Polyangiaceae bacterium]